MHHIPAPPPARRKWAVVTQGHRSQVIFRGPLAECVKRAQPHTVVVPA